MEYLNYSQAEKGTTFEYLLIFYFLCLGGNPILTVGNEYYAIISVIVLFIIALIRKSLLFNLELRNWFIALSILFVFQTILLPIHSIPAVFNYFARFYCGFLIMKMIGDKFRHLYFQVMTIISAISLLVFAFSFIGISLPGFEIGRNINLIVYNYIPSKIGDAARNCGIFWEPGAFQAYIMLAFILFVDNIRLLWDEYRRSSFILIVALFTTFSTTGYVTLAFFAFLLALKKVQNLILRTILATLLIVISVWAFNTFDFLGEKISTQWENSLDISYGEISWTRFGAATIDWYQIKQSPLIGNGFAWDQRYPGIGALMAGSGNGFTGSINMFGIPLMLFYIISLFKKAPSSYYYEKLVYISIIILLLNGEYLLNYMPFWALLFIEKDYNYEYC